MVLFLPAKIKRLRLFAHLQTLHHNLVKFVDYSDIY